MFFKTHQEGKIGYKELSKADLGDSKGHTTHIGLFEGILEFLPNRDYTDLSMFIYNSECTPLEFAFDRIENPDGTFRSPKIKTGGKNVATVTSVIRNTYRQFDSSYRWFLFWFGLKNETAVFYFFNDHSSDYNIVKKMISLDPKCHGKLDIGSANYDSLIHYLECIVNTSNKELIADLELESQVGSNQGKYRKFDIQRANEMFKLTGQRGEKLVAEYLDKLKFTNQIINYTWENQSKESGLPYDFTIQHKNNMLISMDVKSTLSDFKQPMVFSSQEIDYITKTPNYSIFRVYNLSSESNNFLRTCDNSKQLASIINKTLITFKENLGKNEVKLQTSKLLVPSNSKILKFGNQINLNDK